MDRCTISSCKPKRERERLFLSLHVYSRVFALLVQCSAVRRTKQSSAVAVVGAAAAAAIISICKHSHGNAPAAVPPCTLIHSFRAPRTAAAAIPLLDVLLIKRECERVFHLTHFSLFLVLLKLCFLALFPADSFAQQARRANLIPA